MEGRLGILGMHFCEKGKLPGERGQVEEDGQTLEMRKMPRPGRKHGGEERTKRIFTCLELKGRVKGWAWWFLWGKPTCPATLTGCAVPFCTA